MYFFPYETFLNLDTKSFRLIRALYKFIAFAKVRHLPRLIE